jgi:hypothetical protein
MALTHSILLLLVVVTHTRTLTANEYEKVSNITMEILHERLERLVEEYSPEGANGWEVEYSVSLTIPYLVMMREERWNIDGL